MLRWGAVHGVTIRGWRDTDAERVAALTHRFFPPDPPWTPESAREELHADALGNARQVRVAERDGEVVGIAGWVAEPPWVYLWPLTAVDGGVVDGLVDAVLAAAAAPGIDRVRVSVRDTEPHKAAALAARGMRHTLDWIVMRRDVRDAAELPAPDGLRWVPGHRIDRAALLATYNAAFAEIPLTAPATPGDLDRMLDGASAWPEGTWALTGPGGAVEGFLIGEAYPDHWVVEGIGTSRAWRRRGLGRVLLRRAMSALAASGGGDLRAVIASTNAASLGLHASEGFTEHARKAVWEMPLP